MEEEETMMSTTTTINTIRSKVTATIIIVLTAIQLSFLPISNHLPPKFQFFNDEILMLPSSYNNNNNNITGDDIDIVDSQQRQQRQSIMMMSSSSSQVADAVSKKMMVFNDDDEDNSNNNNIKKTTKTNMDYDMKDEENPVVVVDNSSSYYPSTKTMMMKTTTTTTTIDDVDNEVDDDDDNTDNIPPWWISTMKNADTLLKDIDIQRSYNETTCGWWKCYYPSLSHPSEYGYIIGQRRDVTISTKVFAIHNIQKTYDLALRLSTKYKLNHFMVPFAQPKPMNATKALVDILNIGLVEYYGSNYQYLHKFRITTPHKYKRDKIIVQVVKAAPKPNLFIHLKHVIPYGNILNIPTAKNFFNNKEENDLMFHTNLIQDWNNTCLALSNEPDLYRDFQFMLDSYGHIWHIDLDRFYDRGNEDKHLRSIELIQNVIIDPILNLTTTTKKKTKIKWPSS